MRTRSSPAASVADDSETPEPLDALDTLEAVYERVEGVEALANAITEQLQHARFVADSDTHAARRRLGQLISMLVEASEATRIYVWEAVERLTLRRKGRRS